MSDLSAVFQQIIERTTNILPDYNKSNKFLVSICLEALKAQGKDGAGLGDKLMPLAAFAASDITIDQAKQINETYQVQLLETVNFDDVLKFKNAIQAKAYLSGKTTDIDQALKFTQPYQAKLLEKSSITVIDALSASKRLAEAFLTDKFATLKDAKEVKSDFQLTLLRETPLTAIQVLAIKTQIQADAYLTGKVNFGELASFTEEWHVRALSHDAVDSKQAILFTEEQVGLLLSTDLSPNDVLKMTPKLRDALSKLASPKDTSEITQFSDKKLAAIILLDSITYDQALSLSEKQVEVINYLKSSTTDVAEVLKLMDSHAEIVLKGISVKEVTSLSAKQFEVIANSSDPVSELAQIKILSDAQAEIVLEGISLAEVATLIEKQMQVIATSSDPVSELTQIKTLSDTAAKIVLKGISLADVAALTSKQLEVIGELNSSKDDIEQIKTLSDAQTTLLYYEISIADITALTPKQLEVLVYTQGVGLEQIKTLSEDQVELVLKGISISDVSALTSKQMQVIVISSNPVFDFVQIKALTDAKAELMLKGIPLAEVTALTPKQLQVIEKFTEIEDITQLKKFNEKKLDAIILLDTITYKQAFELEENHAKIINNLNSSQTNIDDVLKLTGRLATEMSYSDKISMEEALSFSNKAIEVGEKCGTSFYLLKTFTDKQLDLMLYLSSSKIEDNYCYEGMENRVAKLSDEQADLLMSGEAGTIVSFSKEIAKTNIYSLLESNSNNAGEILAKCMANSCEWDGDYYVTITIPRSNPEDQSDSLGQNSYCCSISDFLILS